MKAPEADAFHSFLHAVIFLICQSKEKQHRDDQVRGYWANQEEMIEWFKKNVKKFLHMDYYSDITQNPAEERKKQWRWNLE